MVNELIDPYNMSEAAVLDEIQLGIKAIIQSHEHLFGAGVIRKSFNVPGASDELWRDGKELSNQSVEDSLALVYRSYTTQGEDVDLDLIHVHRYPITLIMRILYEYVTKARFPKYLELDDLLHASKTFVDSVFSSQEYYGEILNDMPICNGIIEQSIARGKLDAHSKENFNTIWTDEGGSSYLDVSHLAHIDVRTVRNAVTRNELEIFTEDGKSYVDPESALNWLKKRGKFKDTVVYCISEIHEYKEYLERLKNSNDLKFIDEELGLWAFKKKKNGTVLKLVADIKEPNSEPKIVESIKKPFRVETVTLTKTNIKNYSFSVREIYDHLSKDVIGGSNRDDEAKLKLQIELPDGSLISTDVDGSKKILRDRKIIRRFYEVNNFKIGDKVRVLWLDKNYLRLEPIK